MQPNLEALLFDVDGTLADTEEVHRQAFNLAFTGAGLDWYWSEDLYHELLKVTGGRERIRFYLQRDRPEFELPDDADGFTSCLMMRMDLSRICINRKRPCIRACLQMAGYHYDPVSNGLSRRRMTAGCDWLS
jgi:hypothetical protein